MSQPTPSVSWNEHQKVGNDAEVERQEPQRGFGIEPWDEDDDELNSRINITIWLPLTDLDRPLHQRASRYLELTIQGILHILRFGTAQRHGGTSKMVDGIVIQTSSAIHVSWWKGWKWEEPNWNEGIIKQMLWWLRAPVSTAFRDTKSFERLALDLSDPDTDGVNESYLGICVPSISRGKERVTHTLPKSLEEMLTSTEILGANATCVKQESPSEHEAYLTVTATDGGSLGFDFFPPGRRWEMKGTAAVALRKVTPQVSAILHRLMEASGAVLSPVALAAKELPEEIRAKWAEHQVVDVDTLHSILAARAFLGGRRRGRRLREKEMERGRGKRRRRRKFQGRERARGVSSLLEQ